MKRAMLLLALAAASPLVYLSYYLIGPDIDNLLKLKTSQDLKLLQRYPAAGVTLQDVVTAKYRVKVWDAYHEDWIFATRIDCQVLDRSGQALVLSWEVRHNNPPRDWMAKRKLYITPLTRAAAKLAPTLLPSGVQPDDLPISKFGAGVVYDIARERKNGSSAESAGGLGVTKCVSH